MTPSESITRYVGIVGVVDGREKAISDVNLLFTAPGNRTLQRWNIIKVLNTLSLSLSFESPLDAR